MYFSLGDSYQNLNYSVLCMLMMRVVNRNTEEEIGLVPKAVTKGIKQPSQNSLLGVFLTFL